LKEGYTTDPENLEEYRKSLMGSGLHKDALKKRIDDAVKEIDSYMSPSERRQVSILANEGIGRMIDATKKHRFFPDYRDEVKIGIANDIMRKIGIATHSATQQKNYKANLERSLRENPVPFENTGETPDERFYRIKELPKYKRFNKDVSYSELRKNYSKYRDNYEADFSFHRIIDRPYEHQPYSENQEISLYKSPTNRVANRIPSYMSNSSYIANNSHMSVVIRRPDDRYEFWDPHQMAYDNPLSTFYPHKDRIKNLLEDKIIPHNEETCPAGSIQGRFGTCKLWSKLRRAHPEKSPEEFRQMVEEAIANPKPDLKRFITKSGKVELYRWLKEGNKKFTQENNIPEFTNEQNTIFYNTYQRDHPEEFNSKVEDFGKEIARDMIPINIFNQEDFYDPTNDRTGLGKRRKAKKT
jgi:hypothetical protein